MYRRDMGFADKYSARQTILFDTNKSQFKISTIVDAIADIYMGQCPFAHTIQAMDIKTLENATYKLLCIEILGYVSRMELLFGIISSSVFYFQDI